MPLELIVNVSVSMERSVGVDTAAPVVPGGSRKVNVDVPTAKPDDPREKTAPETATAGL